MVKTQEEREFWSNLERMEAEWEQWQALCRLLKESGAVTDGDLQSRVTELDTPGQRLLEQIRVWGRSMRALGREDDDNDKA